ncbi:MAG TPA: hypothetical protein VKG79_16590 [Bryobacteraceae bacterium]|nr:hypothetical protein [Bryobacteraceae bacterium]
MKICDCAKPAVRGVLAPLLSLLLVVMPVLARDAEPPLAQAPAPPAAPGQSAAPAQAAAPVQAAAPGPPPASLPTVEDLKVIALAGKNEVNDIQRRVMAPLVVQVLDGSDRPVQNAEVVFRFPLQGPGAAFPGGKTSLTAHTNGQGQVAAMNWMANNEVGRFEVHVSASYGNEIGSLVVPMSNANNVPVSKVGAGSSTASEKHRSWFSPTWVKVAVIGGAAAVGVGIFLATRGGGSKTGAGSTITISPGSPSVGGPH